MTRRSAVLQLNKGVIALLVLAVLFVALLTNRAVAQALSADIEEISAKAAKEFERYPVDVQPEYDPFRVDEIRIEGDWAILNVVSRAQPSDNWPDGSPPVVVMGVAHKVDSSWLVWLETSPTFEEVFPGLPEWLSWLGESYMAQSGASVSSVQTTYSIPGLPWYPGEAWRYNQGPAEADHVNEFDFGVPSIGTSALVRVAESGVVESKDGTCIRIRRPSDGLRLFYQHISSSDLLSFTVGQWVNIGDRLGYTTTDLGCGATSNTNHHVHFSFLQPGITTHTVLNPQGFSMNGWVVSGNSLIKNGQTVTANFTSTVLYSGCGEQDVSTGVRLYNDKVCTGTSLEVASGFQNLWSPMYHNIESIKVAPGYQVRVYYGSNGGAPSRLFTGDMWDLNKDLYDNSSQVIANTISSVEVTYGTCQAVASAVGVQSAYDCTVPPTNTPTPTPTQTSTPPPPTTTGGEVELYSLANYGGTRLWNGSVGFTNAPSADSYSLRIPIGWSVRTWKGNDRSGETRCWESSVANLQDHSWQLAIQSLEVWSFNNCPQPATPTPAPTIGVELFVGTNFTGGRELYPPGFSNAPSGNAYSMRIPDGPWSAKTWRQDNRGGEERCWNYSVGTLNDIGYENAIQSIEVFDHDVCTPSSPDSVTIINATSAGLTVTWNDKSNNEDGFIVYQWDGTSSWYLSSVGPGVTSFVHGGLPCNSTFSYKVSAFNENGTTIPNGPGSGATSACPTATPTSVPPPATPLNFRVLGSTDTSITVGWDDVTDETGFRVYLWDGAEWVLWGSTGTNVTSYTESGLTCGTQRYFAVTAHSSAGESSKSPWVFASTTACPTPTYTPTPTSVPPTPTFTPTPSSLTVRLYSSYNYSGTVVFEGGPGFSNLPAANSESLQIPWNWSVKTWEGDDRTGRERCWTGSEDTLLQFDWNDRIQSVEVFTSNVCPVIPNPPTVITVTGVTSSSISIAWNDRSTNETGFNVYAWDKARWQPQLIATVGANVTTFTHTGLSCNDWQNYHVSAVNGPSESLQVQLYGEPTTLPCNQQYTIFLPAVMNQP